MTVLKEAQRKEGNMSRKHNQQVWSETFCFFLTRVLVTIYKQVYPSVCFQEANHLGSTQRYTTHTPKIICTLLRHNALSHGPVPTFLYYVEYTYY